jgi:uncharacterized protein YndB with AHSA1/START domain
MAEFRSVIDIGAPPETVFRYLVTDEGMSAWMGQWAALEPVPGGAFAVSIAGYRVRGSFLEVDPPRRVIFSWGFEGSSDLPPGASTVSFELTETDLGTRVELVHTDLPDGEVPGHADGWRHFLPRLVDVAGGATLPPDTWKPAP